MIDQINVQTLKALLDQGQKVHLLDIRQPWEHELSALPNSVLIPLDKLSLEIEDLEADNDELVVVYCHHGVRSLSGAAMLLEAGFTKVASLAGGIEHWSCFIDPTVPRY